MNLSAVLLAGGASRRMGVDKATLRVGQEMLWRRQLRTLQDIAPQQIWLSCRHVPAWCPEDLEPILDRPPSRGPLSGIAAALGMMKTSHLLVLGIDLPRVTTLHLNQLWAAAKPSVGVIPVYQTDFEPLCAIYPRQAAPLAEAALQSGDYSLQHLARALVASESAVGYPISPESAALYLNLNTPADLDSL